MKLSLFTLSLLLTGSLCASDKNNISATKEGINAIKLLGKTLKTNLKAKLQEDSSGTTAIAFCTSEAQNITAQVNEKLPDNIKVRRTSLNLRNPANKPDATDIRVMKRYKEALKNHSSSATLITTVEEGGATRVYKPLVVSGVCLKCHGENIAPGIASAIKASYPEDNATGLKAGEFRGVIVAEVKK